MDSEIELLGARRGRGARGEEVVTKFDRQYSRIGH